jgi:Phage tail protein
VVQQAGKQLMASVRCQQRSMPTTLGYASPGNDKTTLQLVASDPRRYAPAQQTATTGLYAATGGLAYPITYPLNWGTITSDGALPITNSGDTSTPPTFTITGGGNTPSITRQDTGQSLMLDLNLQPTDVLVVDVLNDRILLDGSSVYSVLDPSSDPVSAFFIAPGTTSIGLSVASGTGTVLTATWQSAYL